MATWCTGAFEAGLIPLLRSLQPSARGVPRRAAFKHSQVWSKVNRGGRRRGWPGFQGALVRELALRAGEAGLGGRRVEGVPPWTQAGLLPTRIGGRSSLLLCLNERSVESVELAWSSSLSQLPLLLACQQRQRMQRRAQKGLKQQAQQQ